MTIAPRLIAAGAAFLTAFPAHAHFGHVGELAGHSHWIGIAAAGAAAVIAAGLTALGKKKDAEEPEEEAVEDSNGTEAEAEAKA